MHKIVYMFGAGASQKALPTVKEIPSRLAERIEFLQNPDFFLSDSATYPGSLKTKREVQNDLIKDLKWLLEASDRHASVDTFAKKLFVKGELKNLKRLKTALSVFITLEECENSPDKRYDAFFASILKESILSFPDNVRIVSWNFDSQFEITYSEYSDSIDFLRNQTFLKIITKNSQTKADNKFSIYKLNGSTGYYSPNGLRELMLVDSIVRKKIEKNQIDIITENYWNLINNEEIYPSMAFAWEEEKSGYNFIKQVIGSIEGASILIVIGYSFPYFNREVDRMILNSMGSLNKVYFQSPEAEIIRERFYSIRNDVPNKDLLVRNDVGQFLLPNEL